jgi:hypothetical protein
MVTVTNFTAYNTLQSGVGVERWKSSPCLKTGASDFFVKRRHEEEP